MEKLHLKKSDLQNRSTFISIDCGSILLKCIYLDYEDDGHNGVDSNPNVIFTCRIFNVWDEREELYNILQSRITKINGFQTKLVLLTGLRNNLVKSELEKRLNVQVKTMSEMEAMAHGIRYIMKADNKDDFCYLPEIDPNMTDLNNRLIQKMVESWKKKSEANSSDHADKNYPILYVSAGRSTRFILIDEFDEGKELSQDAIGGESFLGLAKCLIDENEFDLVLKLAAKGNRGNVDTQIKDVLGEITDSPYGEYPPDLPIFNFGKAMEVNSNDVIHFKKEDISLSLVSMILIEVANLSIKIATKEFCKTIFFGGYLLQNKMFRLEYTRLCKKFPELIKAYFLKGGIESNLGLIFFNEN